ncbi:Variable large protein 10 (plasmid) [Borrelia turicatae]|uniref:Variable large protein n=1 Tax=Borrelia turicatae TaxID=142 RepID=A0A172XDK7_BORTU|nr:variable large family protein [Borrelia turicatae]ANF34649.1 Variable large protein 10 [Borrelia turicatae]UPA15846.1 variable large family protein [Borrelia turicatae]
MKRITLSALLMTLFLLLSCGSGQLQAEKLAAESKISFFDSLIKIGQGFQEIFGIFGNAIGDALGFSAVKSTDNRSKVGEHLNKVKKGLEDTRTKLNDLSGKISEVTSADGNTVEAVKSVIQGTGEVFDKLIAALTKLAGAVGNTLIGDAADNATAVVAEKASVDAVIESVKEIIEVAKNSGVKIEDGQAGGPVAANAGGEAVAKTGGGASANVGPKLADEVAKADPWAMLDKIKDAKTDGALQAANDNEAGVLATALDAANTGSKTNADLAAAVALKAMTKGGKFSVNSVANEGGAIKAAAVTAVNKVLGVLNVVIQRTVSSNLDKIREAVKGIQYSETTTESTEASTTTQPTVTK